MSNCNICPRRCGIDRTERPGLCGADEDIRIAKVMLHEWEEPCLSAPYSGAIFFSGCSLSCVYCQNREISRNCSSYRKYSIDELSEIMLKLQSDGASNIDLVTPTHYTIQIVEALGMIKDRLKIPVVWNTGGYELPETIRSLAGLVDVFLTDFKYFSGDISSRYSHCPDYSAYATEALKQMVAVTGRPVFENGCENISESIDKRKIRKGVILRHLVLPGCRKDSIDVLKNVSSAVGPENVIISLMSQYVPDFVDGIRYPELKRKLTSYEYESVVEAALDLGYEGYIQSGSSAQKKYTPDF